MSERPRQANDAAFDRRAVLDELEELDEFEAMRAAPYPNPADADRGEVLVATGVGVGVVGVGMGVIAAAALCPPCVLGALPFAAVAAPGLVGAGILKRWRRRRREAAACAAPEKTSSTLHRSDLPEDPREPEVGG